MGANKDNGYYHRGTSHEGKFINSPKYISRAIIMYLLRAFTGGLWALYGSSCCTRLALSRLLGAQLKTLLGTQLQQIQAVGAVILARGPPCTCSDLQQLR